MYSLPDYGILFHCREEDTQKALSLHGFWNNLHRNSWNNHTCWDWYHPRSYPHYNIRHPASRYSMHDSRRHALLHNNRESPTAAWYTGKPSRILHIPFFHLPMHCMHSGSRVRSYHIQQNLESHHAPLLPYHNLYIFHRSDPESP